MRKARKVGQLEISVEEGVIQNLMLRRKVVADAPIGECKLLDATLTKDAATGLSINQAYARISAHCLGTPRGLRFRQFAENVQRRPLSGPFGGLGGAAARPGSWDISATRSGRARRLEMK